MAQGRIPWRAIIEYARECIGSDPMAFAEIIMAMDDACLVIAGGGKGDKKFSREKMRGK